MRTLLPRANNQHVCWHKLDHKFRSIKRRIFCSFPIYFSRFHRSISFSSEAILLFIIPVPQPFLVYILKRTTLFFISQSSLLHIIKLSAHVWSTHTEFSKRPYSVHCRPAVAYCVDLGLLIRGWQKGIPLKGLKYNPKSTIPDYGIRIFKKYLGMPNLSIVS